MTVFDLQRYAAYDASALIVAEAGVNHGGDLGIAREMVRSAASTGVDVIKFQTYKAERLTVRASAAYWDRSKEPTATQYELFKKYDRFDADDYRALAAEAGVAGLVFCTTPFDPESVDWLDELLPLYKIASADITNTLLLERVARTGKPVLLSTGASRVDEIEEAVKQLELGGCPCVGLLHCTLSYPTAAADAAIGAIRHLAEVFPGQVLGYSDHTVPKDSHAAIAAAYALGARVIEKHFTLDKSLPGNDHYHAFDPGDFRALRIELDDLRELLGAPRKQVLPAEEAARLHARRSLVARVDIPAGTRIEASMLDAKRPGTGIEPRELKSVVGRIASASIAEDETLQWAMLSDKPA